MAQKKGMLREGGIAFSVGSRVFYNPEMELCRDISSLCVGAIGEKMDLADAMCASGVRGLRYKKENRNVKSLALCDASASAVLCARKNAAKNRIRCTVRKSDARDFLRKNSFDFLELDPFGSPAPFLHDAAISCSRKKKCYLSATATDMAVLCGADHSACMRNYGAAPMNNEFCHENAVRILAGKVVLAFAPLNMAVKPIFTISHRHYVKMIFETVRDFRGATEAVKLLGFVSYCPACCFREAKRFPISEKCPHCSHQLEHGGPLYRGRLWDEKLLEKMLRLNATRGYARAAQAEKMLAAMLSESRIGCFGYYDLHVLARKLGGRIIGMEAALESLRREGFACSRTHFCPTAIRTDAPHRKIVELVKR